MKETLNEIVRDLSSEIAETYLEATLNPDLVCIWDEDENGDLRLTEEAQDAFNECLDKIEPILSKGIENLLAEARKKTLDEVRAALNIQ